MAFVVIYDACVLYPVGIRDLLIRLAETGLFQARWTDEILDECFENILKNRPDLSPAKLQRTRELMNEAIPDAMIEGYQELIHGLSLPDADDRHVLAAAIRAGAQVIVTNNLKHFPSKLLIPYGVEAQTPDTFVSHVLSLDAQQVIETLKCQSAGMRSPPTSLSKLLDLLERAGLTESVPEIREVLASGPAKGCA